MAEPCICVWEGKDGYTLILKQALSCVGCLSSVPYCAYAEAFVCVDVAENKRKVFCGLEQPTSVLGFNLFLCFQYLR